MAFQMTTLHFDVLFCSLGCHVDFSFLRDKSINSVWLQKNIYSKNNLMILYDIMIIKILNYCYLKCLYVATIFLFIRFYQFFSKTFIIISNILISTGQSK